MRGPPVLQFQLFHFLTDLVPLLILQLQQLRESNILACLSRHSINGSLRSYTLHFWQLVIYLSQKCQIYSTALLMGLGLNNGLAWPLMAYSLQNSAHSCYYSKDSGCGVVEKVCLDTLPGALSSHKCVGRSSAKRLGILGQLVEQVKKRPSECVQQQC